MKRLQGDPGPGEVVVEDAAQAVALFCEHVLPGWRGRIRAGLRGHNLACWCELGADVSCHCDPMLEAANE